MIIKSILSRRFLVALVSCSSLRALAGDALDTTKPADIEHMKAIGVALNAYKKAKGEFPDHLSDLVPNFLEAKTLLSPLGEAADPDAAKGKNDPRLPCSYVYQFSTDTVWDYNWGRSCPRRAINRFELDEYGPTTPVLRCFLYQQALNLSHGGEIFLSDGRWEESPQVLTLFKKNGYGPGPAGKKLIVHLTDDAGQPVAGVALAVSGRESSEKPLARRDFSSDEKGGVTIPLGTDRDARATFQCRQSAWFLAAYKWTWGEDQGTPTEGDLAAITVALQPAVSIGGIVRDAAGHPLPNTKIYVGKPAPDVAPTPDPNLVDVYDRTETDADGRWELPSFPRKSADLKIVFGHAGSRTIAGAPGEGGVPDAAALIAKTADLRLPPPFLVKGTVLSKGRPLPGATVCLMAPFGADQRILPIGDEPRKPQATTDDHGQFELAAAAEGTGVFIVMAQHLAPLYQEVKIAADGPACTFALESGRPARALAVDGNHVPLPGVTLFFDGFESFVAMDPPTQPVIGVTDAEGRIIWDHAPKIPFRFKVHTARGTLSSRWDPTKPGEAQLDLRIDE